MTQPDDPTSTARKQRRRQLVVQPELQQRIILRVILLPALALAAIGAIVSFETAALMGEAAAAEVELTRLRPLLLSVLGFIVIAGGVLIHQAVHFSHRIAGPVYNITRAMREHRAGNAARRIRLRRGDYLAEIADEFNLLVASSPRASVDAPPPAVTETASAGASR
jgi:hypothetical protein